MPFSAKLVAQLISEVTGRDESDVLSLLKSEFRDPGSTVRREAMQRGVTPHVHTEAMDALYSESDSFLFESAVWNCNDLKGQMRRRVCSRLDEQRKAGQRESLDVLVIGDGPGFDSLELAQAGHRVTYHELPGLQEQFAQRLFAHCGCDVRIITDRSQVPEASFDAVVCLDVLEHVEDPPAVVRSLTRHMRPEAILAVHAPFYMIHRAYPTHLFRNRRLSGSMKLYRQAGLRLVHGSIGWNPLFFSFSNTGASPAPLALRAAKRLGIHASGFYFVLGRWTAVPFIPIHRARCARGRWFEE